MLGTRTFRISGSSGRRTWNDRRYLQRLSVRSLVRPRDGLFSQDHTATRFARSCSHQREGATEIFAVIQPGAAAFFAG